jgi:hypothetical protein
MYLKKKNDFTAAFFRVSRDLRGDDLRGGDPEAEEFLE